MTSRVQNGVTYCQTFDNENHLVTVENLSSGSCSNKTVATTTSFVYDGDGNRVKRIVNDGTTTTTTIYVAGMEIEVVGSTESKRTIYYAAGGAFRVVGGADAGLYYRHADHLNSGAVISDSTGAKVANSDVVYAPFGEIRSGALPTITDFGFTGQHLDRSTGDLMYFGARYYLPGLRRFVSPDTILPDLTNPQALNRFSYAYNNPVKYNDPTGHCPMCVTALVGAGIGLVVGAAVAAAPTIIENAQAGRGAFDGMDWAKVGAYALGGAVGGAVIGVTFGLASEAVAAAGAAAVATDVATTGAGVGTAVCADGDCTNEVRAVGQAVCGDGDCTNEISQAKPVLDSVDEVLDRTLTTAANNSTKLQNGQRLTRQDYDIGSKLSLEQTETAFQQWADKAEPYKRIVLEQADGLGWQYRLDILEWEAHIELTQLMPNGDWQTLVNNHIAIQ